MKHEPEQEYIVVARAPMRASLAGGGTDLPSYSGVYGGMVISLAITRYVAVMTYPRSFDGTIRLSGYESEVVNNLDLLRNAFVRSALLRTGNQDNIQIASCSDAPAGTGLGGSGAFTVALMHALRKRISEDPKDLAEEASAIEICDLARPVGKHDHYMAAFGGLRVLRFQKDGVVNPESVHVCEEISAYIKTRLLLFYTGFSRDAGKVLGEQDIRMRGGDHSTVNSLHTIRNIADQMLESIRAGRVDDIGPLLHEHWMSKVKLSSGVSNGRIDHLYEACRDAGSDGGKLLGAGGGGFLLVSAKQGYRDQVVEQMAGLGIQQLPFGLDTTGSMSIRMPI